MAYSNEVLKLDTPSFTFSKVNIINAAEGPMIMRKQECGMIAVSSNTLLVVGGYGIPGAALPRGFVVNKRYKDGRGWTNEIHLLNITEGEPHPFADLWGCG